MFSADIIITAFGFRFLVPIRDAGLLIFQMLKNFN
jgi:hypothetical protein